MAAAAPSLCPPWNTEEGGEGRGGRGEGGGGMGREEGGESK